MYKKTAIINIKKENSILIKAKKKIVSLVKQKEQLTKKEVKMIYFTDLFD
jgi:hypothetical protein